MIRQSFSIVLILLLTAGGQAQQATLQSSLAQSAKLVLDDGTPVKLRLARDVSSADAKAGDTVDFEVSEEVRIGDALVIPKGAVALGRITDCRSTRRMAGGGRLQISVDTVRLIDGEKTALRAVKNAKGRSRAPEMYAGMALISMCCWPAMPAFFLVRGNDTTLKKGTELTAYVNGDFQLK